MSTSFFVQASNPRTLRALDAEDESLSDALQTVFPFDTEQALIVWNHIRIPLDYKYDLSLMAADVVGIIEMIQVSPQGRHTVHWPSSTFSAIWDMQWSSGILTIHSEWHCVLGSTEALLTGKPDVELPSDDFVAEWKRPLQFAERALTEAGYDVGEIRGLARLRTVLARCVRDGVLYRD